MVKFVRVGDTQATEQVPFICRPTHNSHPPGIFYGQNPLNHSFSLVLLEVALVILITRLVRFILKPLKQPRIVSEILGGIIIGPSVLGRNKKFAAYVFPDNASFVFKNFGLIGFIYFLFLSGVKMDLTAIRKTGKKQLYIAVFGVLIPVLAVVSIAVAIRKSLGKELAKGPVIGGVATAFSITTFPVLYQIIKELNLLSSEVGKLALSTVLVSDVIGINCIVVFEAARAWEANSIDALWYLLSFLGILVIIGGARQAMIWIVRITPEGKPVDQAYVVAILLGVMVIAFLSDISGVAVANGPLWLGLAVPDGPPLGATLVEKAETIVDEFFMPFSFAFVGMYTDISSLSGHWSSLLPIFVMAWAAYLTKFITTLVITRFFQMPVRDGLSLSLVMSLRGQLEILIFMHWMDLRIIEYPSFTILVLSTTVVTAIATPLIRILYDPTRPYMVNKRRAIQYTPPNTELHIVACIHDQESVAGFIDLLEVSNPTVASPFSVYALRLIELVGRASPVFIDHEHQAQAFELTSFNRIHNALKNFQESRGEEFIKFHLFTSVSPKRTMFQDICELALMKKATFILLPFKKEDLETRTEVVNRGVRLKTVNSSVLAHAPCSMGILVDKVNSFRTHIVNYSLQRVVHHLIVLFLGGADAREALAFADRMAGHPNVSVTAIRFLSFNGEGDNEMEKKLDDGLVTWFWVKNEGNERVIYREVVVKNGDETVAAIRAMSNDCYNLWIVGRKQGINPVLIQGLSNWSQNHELGVIGDIIASMDLGSNSSVLVVQQQILRGQEVASVGLLGRFLSCTY